MKSIAFATAVFSLAVAASIMLAAALAHAAARPGLHWGPVQPLGAGTARAWVAVDMDGEASSMGVQLDPAAFESARIGHDTDAVLPLPVTAGVRASGSRRGPQPAFRVRFDEKTRNYVVVLEGLKAVPQLSAAR
jgi:hypothetical protein